MHRTPNEAALAIGLEGLPYLPPADGKIHRPRKHSSFWIVNFGDGGALGDWRTGAKATWHQHGSASSPAERKRLAMQIREAQEREKRERYRKWEIAATEAVSIWGAANTEGHSDYLMQKQVAGHGIRFRDGCILVPVHDALGTLWSLQTIWPDSSKRFLRGGKKKGCFHLIGTCQPDMPLALCEGYATGATIHDAIGWPVAVAFDAGNLQPVAKAILSHNPDLALVICGDDDRWKPDAGNTGRNQAMAVAAEFHIPAIFPDFPQWLHERRPTDWNDLHVLAGMDAVRYQLRRV